MNPALRSIANRLPTFPRRAIPQRVRASGMMGAALALMIARIAFGAGGSAAAVTNLPMLHPFAPKATQTLVLDTRGLTSFDGVLTLSATGDNAPAPAQLAAAEQAVAINAAMPISTQPNPKAIPFQLATTLTTDDRQRALDCLTAAIYYEAASEPDAGQAAVAQVVLNRVRNPHYPKSVCAVVFDRSEGGTCQFTFTCDGALNRVPSPAGWQRARKAAEAALAGKVDPAVGWATHYHTQWVAPVWAPTLLKTAVIGAHIFYRQPYHWDAKAPQNHYVGTEPALPQMVALGTPSVPLPGTAPGALPGASPLAPPTQVAETAKPKIGLLLPSA